MKGAIVCAAALALSLGCALVPSALRPASPVDSNEPARVVVRSLTGLSGPSPTPRPPRIAVVLDATQAMALRTPIGASHLTSARVAIERLLAGLDAETEVEHHVVGGNGRSGCDTPAESIDPSRLRRVGARGEGSIARALEALLEAPDREIVDRAVVFTRLVDTCGDDLCAAASALAERGVRLDLVVVGNEPTPACLAEIARSEADATPEGWRGSAAIHYRVESVGADPAVQGCSETDGLPVLVQPGDAAIVIDLDPPLRVERRFEPDSRWLLEIVAFPGLDPPERMWRWRPLPEASVASMGDSEP